MTRKNWLYLLIGLSAFTALAQYAIQGGMAGFHNPVRFPPAFWYADYALWALRALIESAVIAYLFRTVATTTGQRVGLAVLEFILIALIAATLGPALRAVGYGSTMLASLGEPWFTLWTFGIASYTPLMMGAAGFAYKVQPEDNAPAVTVAPAEREQLSPVARRGELVTALRATPDISASTLAKQVGVSRTTVSKDLDALVTEGTLSRNGRGYRVR